MLANLLALGEEGGIGPRLLTAFMDAEVAEVLGIEPPREAPVALLAAGRARPPARPAVLPPGHEDALPLSPREHRFPEAEEVQASSELETGDEARAWREAAAGFHPADRPRVEPPTPLDEVILRRGSAGAFRLESIGRDELGPALTWACAAVPGDLPPLCSTLVIAHAVEASSPRRTGSSRRTASRRPARARPAGRRRICALDQAHGGSAAATIFLTADLDRVLGPSATAATAPRSSMPGSALAASRSAPTPAASTPPDSRSTTRCGPRCEAPTSR
jgi:hypothetical protein